MVDGFEYNSISKLLTLGLMKYSIIFLLITVQQIGFGQLNLEGTLDSIILNGIDSMAFPGAQLYVIHKDKVIINKTYGHHTYEKQKMVSKTDLYDLASLTKVMSGLPILMKLYDKGMFDLDVPASTYIPYWKKTNKAHQSFRDILSHQAGLEPYIVFWAKTMKENGNFKRRTFRSKLSRRFPVKIHENLFLHKRYTSKMWRSIKRSPVNKEKNYKYSGLSFLHMPEMISKMIQSDFETQLYQSFYTPMGIDRLCYNPLNTFTLDDIIPTEKDTSFRKTLVHGRVHDEAAAMLHGVSCNAGLFGNAESVAKLFHMYLRNGNYSGKQYITAQTIKTFTSYQFPENDNRRGLGFDKPPLEYVDGQSYIAKSASSSSFGHSGFTGTFAWADPDHDLLLVFLSNRVYPDRSQRKLYTMNIRPQIHQALYDFLIFTDD